MQPQTTPKASNGLAITALVLGIIAFCLAWTGIFGLILAILALIFGIIALVKKQNKGMGIAGVVLGAVAVIISIIITLVGLAILGGAAHVADQVSKEQRALDNAKKDFAKGETGAFDNLAVKVTTVTLNWQATDGFSKPDDGNQYVFVSLNIKNTSNDTMNVNPFDFKLNDNGVSVDHDIATTSNPLNAVELKPGASIDGDLVFQVKAGDTNLKLQYTTYDTKALKDVTYTLAL